MQTAKPNTRISESDLLLPTLRAIAAQKNGFMTTSALIDHLENEFQPEGEDAEILDNRNDTRFSQIVRNMISHKKSSTNIIGLGYVDHVNGGLQITAAGLSYLKKMGG